MRVGLCETCIYAKVIRNQRESLFFLCEYSKIDLSFQKYPNLPVTICTAHKEAESSQTPGEL